MFVKKTFRPLANGSIKQVNCGNALKFPLPGHQPMMMLRRPNSFTQRSLAEGPDHGVSKYNSPSNYPVSLGKESRYHLTRNKPRSSGQPTHRPAIRGRRRPQLPNLSSTNTLRLSPIYSINQA